MSNFSNIPISSYKVLSLPLQPESNSVYYVLDRNNNIVQGFITDKKGTPIPLFTVDNGSIQSVTGTGVTGTATNPKINIQTFVSNQLGNQVYLSVGDGKLQVNPITSPDSSIEVTPTSTELQIKLSATIASEISSALQPGDNISELVNDAGYVTLLDLATVATTGDYNDLINLPILPSEYTDEQAQDAVGNILTDTATIDLVYNDVLNNISANVKPNSITAGELSDTINISEFVNDSGYLINTNFKTLEGQSLIGVGNIDLNKSDVGLSNVDNTSDLNKPISNATQAALNLKADDTTVLHKTGNETKTGTLTATSFIKSGGTANQLLTANGNTVIYDTDNDGTVDSAESIVVSVELQETVTIGDPVYVSTTGSPNSFVKRSKTNTPSTLPSLGVMLESGIGGTTKKAVLFGKVGGLNTSGMLPNSTIYVGVTGGFTNIKPSQNAQPIGVVLRVGGSDGVIGVNCQEVDTKVERSTTLNINGNSYDLSTNREWRVAQADTGVLTFASPGISVASGTQINISAVTGWVINNETNPSVPTSVYINYPGATNVTVPTIGSGLLTYVMLLPDGFGGGTPVFINTLPSATQRKTHLWLGKAAHPAGVITVAGNEPDYITSPLAQYRGMFQALGAYINDGVIPYPNGANLTINIASGDIHGNGINFVANNTRPDELDVVGVAIPFLPRTQTGAGGAGITNVDVGNYDVAGVVTAIPGSGARATIRDIYYVPNLGFIIQYGQQWYNNLNEAVTAVGRESKIIYPTLTNNSIRVGVLVARKDATALDNINQARFFPADKLGQLIGATAGISTGTLQTAYDNSTTPQLTINDTLGALVIKNNKALDTSTITEWKNIAGTTTASIDGNGLISGNSIRRSATLTSTPYNSILNNEVLIGNRGAGVVPYFFGRNDSTSECLTLTGLKVGNTAGSTGFGDISFRVGFTGGTDSIAPFTSNPTHLAYAFQNGVTNLLTIARSGDTAINGFIGGTVTRVLPSGGVTVGQIYNLSGADSTSLLTNSTVTNFNEDGQNPNGSNVAGGSILVVNKSTNQSSSTYIGHQSVFRLFSTANVQSVSINRSTISIASTGTGTVSSLSLYDTLGAAITNSFPITTYTGLNLLFNPQNNVTNAWGVRIGELYGTTISRGIDLNVSSGTGKYNIYSSGTASNYLNGNTLIGTTTDNGAKLTVGGSINAITGTARGQYIAPTLVATANNDSLIALDISATYTAGAFTNVIPIAARFNAGITPSTDASYNNGFINQNWSRTRTRVVEATTGGFFELGYGGVINARLIGATGNWIFQNGGTFTDAGYRLDVQGTTRLANKVTFGASTTSAALMNLPVGVAPTTPNDGDVWLESNTNTGLKIRIAGVTKTITLT